MGYYTRFEIKTTPPEVISEVQEWLEINEHISEYWVALETLDGDCEEPRKWYGHEDDMKFLSTQFPDVLFFLKGEGSDAGDVWHKYFKNGKMQRCPATLVFDEFDESKLV